MSEHVTSDEPYLLVEEVAERLGLPLSVLLHRVEAGDIPARRVERADGLHYALRLGDLGIELDDRGLRSSAIEHELSDEQEEETLTTAFEPIQEPVEPTVESAIVSAFNSGPERLPGVRHDSLDVTGRRTDDAEAHAANGHGGDADAAAGWGDDDLDEPWRRTEEPAPPWSLRPREPQEPPPWLTRGPAAGDEPPDDLAVVDGVVPDEVAADEVVVEEEVVLDEVVVEPPAEVAEPAMLAGADDFDDDGGEVDVYVPPVALDAEADGMPAVAPSALDAVPDEDLADEDTAVAQLAVPPPSHGPAVSVLDAGSSGPRGDLASMSLDARELVAGLLDRWERTLEQRIYTEQRQRFQAELVARQNMVKQLQMELHTARAEHAAAQAEKDRILAGKERELADRERDLAETRRLALEAERMNIAPAPRRRRWFRGRDD